MMQLLSRCAALATMNTTRQESAALTRERILQSAYELVGESGYDALTANALVAHAGIAKGTLYHHFDSLEAVVFAMIQSLVIDMLEAVPKDVDSLEAYLAACGASHRELIRNQPRLTNVVFGFIPKGMRDPVYRRLVRDELMPAMMAQLKPTLARLYRRTLTDQQLDDLIRLIDMLCIGYSVHVSIMDDEPTYTRIWSQVSDVLVLWLKTIDATETSTDTTPPTNTQRRAP